MADTPPPKRTHKTHAPALTAEDVKFAQLLFAARAQKGERVSVSKCYLDAGFPAHTTEQATQRAAYRRVKNRQFREFYRVLQDTAAVSAQMTPNIVTRGLARIAQFDLREVFDPRGRIKLPCEWSDAVAAGVLSVESEEIFESQEEIDPETKKKVRRKVLVGYTRKVKRVAPTEALKLLAQILRMIGADAGEQQPKDAKANSIVVEIGPDHIDPPPEGAP